MSVCSGNNVSFTTLPPPPPPPPPHTHTHTHSLLYSLEVLADAYPSPSSIVQYVTRDPFRFILIPASFLTTTVHTLTVTQDNSLQLGPAEQARVRVDLPSSMAGTRGLIAGVYNSPSLFVSRPEYVRAQNRSNYVLGSNVGVITVHFSGSLARTELDEPVEIRFWKTDEASQNGTETECAFWDQSLDEGYGAWSGDECVLERETSEFADCACTHLTQFTLLVVSQGLNHLSFSSFLWCGFNPLGAKKLNRSSLMPLKSCSLTLYSPASY